MNAFFRWEFNSCETIVKDGVAYPIDYANASPDVALTSLHYYFPWAITALVRWSAFCAVTRREMHINQNSRDYFRFGDRDDLTYEEKLAQYRKLADAYFQIDDYQEFCDTHLKHLDEIAHEWFSSPAFDERARRDRALDVPGARARALRRALPRAPGRVGWRQRCRQRGLTGAARHDGRMADAAILVVDDDAPIRRMLERTLAAEGYAVESAADGGDALVSVERSTPDLILLDVTMPGLDGLAVCRRLRDKGLATPVLLLTARDELDDRVAGLDAGADDYVVKPFETVELLARVRALLRRGKAPETVLSVGDLTLELETRTVTRGGRVVALSEREADLLELLLRNAHRVVSREQALTQIWGGEANENVVDRYVSNLRRKLGQPPLIDTVRGVGFVLGR